jgi:hypothetical protein
VLAAIEDDPHAIGTDVEDLDRSELFKSPIQAVRHFGFDVERPQPRAGSIRARATNASVRAHAGCAPFAQIGNRSDSVPTKSTSPP